MEGILASIRRLLSEGEEELPVPSKKLPSLSRNRLLSRNKSLHRHQTLNRILLLN